MAEPRRRRASAEEKLTRPDGAADRALPKSAAAQEMLDWFRAHPPHGTATAEDAGLFVSRMRDEEWTR